MNEFYKSNFIRTFFEYFPAILLFISVLNELDLNYLGVKFFSFNFPFILIFYWSLKKNENLGYGLIFIAGLFNDVVIGLPLGLSSLSYMLICGFASYLRYITLRPNLMKDWLFFLFTIIFVNSLNYTIVILFFNLQLDLFYLLTNTVFTFLLYAIFANLFKVYQKLTFGKSDD